jgi:hypothetical protein
MINKEWTCLFHWTQSFDRHTKQLIAPKLQGWQKALCFDYKNVRCLEEANLHYATIQFLWYFHGATSEEAIHELNNWLNFWQWGRFMLDVKMNVELAQWANMPTYNLLETIHSIWLQQYEKRCMLVCYDLKYMIMCELSSNLHYIMPLAWWLF